MYYQRYILLSLSLSNRTPWPTRVLILGRWCSVPRSQTRGELYYVPMIIMLYFPLPCQCTASDPFLPPPHSDPATPTPTPLPAVSAASLEVSALLFSSSPIFHPRPYPPTWPSMYYPLPMMPLRPCPLWSPNPMSDNEPSLNAHPTNWPPEWMITDWLILSDWLPTSWIDWLPDIPNEFINFSI